MVGMALANTTNEMSPPVGWELAHVIWDNIYNKKTDPGSYVIFIPHCVNWLTLEVIYSDYIWYYTPGGTTLLSIWEVDGIVKSSLWS